jgi:small subunit ribosomal protein S6
LRPAAPTRMLTARRSTFLLRPRAGAVVHREGALMRAYEAVLVLSPSLEEDAIVAFLARATQAIEQKGGRVTSVERWGKRRLAYDIQHFKEGSYILVRFEAPPRDGTAELEHVCRISEDVLRHLIVVAVESHRARPEPVKAAEPAAPGVVTPAGAEVTTAPR